MYSRTPRTLDLLLEAADPGLIVWSVTPQTGSRSRRERLQSAQTPCRAVWSAYPVVHQSLERAPLSRMADRAPWAPPAHHAPHLGRSLKHRIQHTEQSWLHVYNGLAEKSAQRRHARGPARLTRRLARYRAAYTWTPAELSGTNGGSFQLHNLTIRAGTRRVLPIAAYFGQPSSPAYAPRFETRAHPKTLGHRRRYSQATIASGKARRASPAVGGRSRGTSCPFYRGKTPSLRAVAM